MTFHATSPRRVLVLGGTGTTGSRICRGLGEAGHEAVPASRSTPVAFDWADPRTHDRVLDGIDAAYLVPPVAVADPAPVMLEFVRRATDAGVRRLVLLSASVIPPGGPGVGMVHAALGDHAPEWAVLRPSWFMQNFASGHYMAQDIATHSRVRTSVGDGRVAFVDADDIAAVGVRALVDDEPHQADHVVTGPEALSYDEVAAHLTTAAGRTIAHERVDRETVRRRLLDAGYESEFAGVLATLEEALCDGAEDRVTDTVQRVTGRPPRSFGAWALAHAPAWR